jgi:hypothetical protein
MVVKRLKPNACGVKVPTGLTGIAKGAKSVEPDNKNNTKPPNRGKGGKDK